MYLRGIWFKKGLICAESRKCKRWLWPAIHTSFPVRRYEARIQSGLAIRACLKRRFKLHSKPGFFELGSGQGLLGRGEGVEPRCHHFF